MKTIAFLGLGIMGMGMAKNIIRSGYDLTVYNRTIDKTKELSKMGAKVAFTPAEAVIGADIAITMLADPTAVADVILGTNGIINSLEPGSILIDCSTVDPSTTLSTKLAVKSRGAEFLDCPVAGSKDAANKGELILMVGGDKSILNTARDVLEVISKKIIYAGPSGSGTNLKLCFNLIVSHMAVALSEALVLGAKSGLNPEIILETIMAGTVSAPFYQWKGNCIMDRDFTPHFSTKLMHKDTNLMMSAGHSMEVPLPVTAVVKELFGIAKNNGHGEEDFSSVVTVLEDMAGIKIQR
ncbi:MAG: NAD(P)-dependent oxidoreductase [Armatimonadota bacterium]